MSCTRAYFIVLAMMLPAARPVAAQIVISGNENKIDLDSGAPTVVQNAAPDSLSILDFSEFPPKVTHVMDVPNTVIGPPSNIAIKPDGSEAWIASSVRIDPADPTQFVPRTLIQKLVLNDGPPRATGFLEPEQGVQLSGMSFTPDGTLLIGANRAAGSVSVFELTPTKMAFHGFVEIGDAGDNPSDVAIAPDGKTALVSLQNRGLILELAIDGTQVAPTDRTFSVYGKPYRVVITPDGRLGITAGAGYGAPTDRDAVSIIDLKADTPHTVQHLTTGSSPESVEISPDGKLLAVVTMDGSNLAADDPLRTQAGGLYLYERTRHGFDFTQYLPTGRIPEGVAFTGDGRYLIVQCHPDREMRIYRVRRNMVEDTGERIQVPGMPSSLRAVR